MKIAVLGSLNMDLVVEVDHLPRSGETVLGRGLARYPGGKGNIQAIAAARLGAEVHLFGRVGKDAFGDELLAVARDAGVAVSAVEQVDGETTGMSMIMVGPTGQNMVAYVPGANGRVSEAYVAGVLPRLAEADAILVQLEIPLSAVAALLHGLPPERPRVILDPAPAQDLTALPLRRVDFLTPNREEFAVLTGWSASGVTEAGRAGQALLDLGVRHLVVTADADGAFLVERGGATRFPAYPVEVVDATGAGDAFNAALAVKLAAGRGPYEAIGFANAVAALAVTRRGAVPALPTLAEVQAFLSRRRSPALG
ncbi:MAG: ribokinase [Candidatus Acetothermia bacterium]|jgi:ribokinase|nr:ribokinase [Candidatus Acetothermia bacterium]